MREKLSFIEEHQKGEESMASLCERGSRSPSGSRAATFRQFC